ncbi:MAG: phosphotransferase family protein [Solirubrobacteraceae bacterium]
MTREITALHADALPGGPAGALVCVGERTSTGVAVVKLARPSAPPSAVLKLTASEEGKRALARETHTLTTLHADERLGAWRDLLPRPCAQGTFRGHLYRIDSALGGRAGTKPPAVPVSRAVSAAAEAIAVLHETTATTVGGGQEVAERWVDAPVRELLRHARGSRRLPDRLEHLRDELHGALCAGSFPAAWIHGDYWLGNLLFDATPLPTGIVDWEAAGPLEFPLHDVLHLLLYTRRLTSGRELGQMLRDQLVDKTWSVAERALLERQPAWHARGGLTERHVLLLYWLRHAAVHARQHASRVGCRYRLWEHRNVLPVLASL